MIFDVFLKDLVPRFILIRRLLTFIKNIMFLVLIPKQKKIRAFLKSVKDISQTRRTSNRLLKKKQPKPMSSGRLIISEYLATLYQL